MASTYYDWVSCAPKTDRTSAFQDHRHIVEEEFSEELRDPHFPAGWYILLFFGVAVLIVAAVYFLT
jgi:hypothetical protein